MSFKQLINQNFTAIGVVTLGTLLSSVLLALRIKVFQDFFLLFLGWNLILALIPFVIALATYKYVEALARPFIRIPIFLIWLLFLPNAPYLLTDFIHLRLSAATTVVFDFVLILSFSVTGCMAGVYAIGIMKQFLNLFYNPLQVKVLVLIFSLLCGYGVYLGRVLRLNSWDVFTRPGTTIPKLLSGLQDPLAWLMTIGCGILIFFGQRCLMAKKEVLPHS